MSAARVLVTGATGVIGRLALSQLLARGHCVTAVGRTPEKRAAFAALGAEAVGLDLLDAAAPRRVLASRTIRDAVGAAGLTDPTYAADQLRMRLFHGHRRFGAAAQRA